MLKKTTSQFVVVGHYFNYKNAARPALSI